MDELGKKIVNLEDLKVVHDYHKAALNNEITSTTNNMSALASRMSAVEGQQTVLTSRMDTFEELPDGSTTGDAELMDIRVGGDGRSYPTAGDAVRGQFDQVKRDLRGVFDKPSTATIGSLTSGGIVSSTGGNVNSEARARTNYIALPTNPVLFFLDSGEYEWLIWTYSSQSVSSAVMAVTNGSYVSSPVVITNDGGATHFRIAFRRKDNHDAVLTTDETSPTSDYSKIRASAKFLENYASADTMEKALVYQRVLTENDDLDDIWNIGTYRWRKSDTYNPPQHSPTQTSGTMIVYGWQSANEAQALAQKTQLVTNRNGVLFSRLRMANGEISEWQIGLTNKNFNDYISFQAVPGSINLSGLEPGSWSASGGRSNAQSIKTPVLHRLYPGTILNFVISEGWRYTIWEGDTPTQLQRTYRLYRGERVQIQHQYVGFNFYKPNPQWNPDTDNGDSAVLTTAKEDWHNQIKITCSIGTTDAETVPAWVQPTGLNPYTTGAKVAHNNRIWICTSASNVSEPGYGVAGWEEDLSRVGATRVDNPGLLYIPVTEGTWKLNGTIGFTDVKALCSIYKYKFSVGSTIHFTIRDNWVYTVWEGDDPDHLFQTHHTTRDEQIILERPYVAFAFLRPNPDYDPDDENSEDTLKAYNAHWEDQVQVVCSGNTTPYETHDFPESVGVANVIRRAYQMTNIQYNTTANLPTQWENRDKMYGRLPEATTPDGDTYHYYKSGVLIPGVMYSSTRGRNEYVPNTISFESYMTALTNPNSYIYTKVSDYYDSERDRRVIYPNSTTYWGSVCSTFVAYCYGIDTVIPTTISFTEDYDDFELLPEAQQKAEYLKLGDALISPNNHIMIVTDIMRDQHGIMSHVEISESWQPYCRTQIFTPQEIDRDLMQEYHIKNPGKEDYRIARYARIDEVTYTPSPWINLEKERSIPFANPNLMTRRGNSTNWRQTDEVEIDILDGTGYTRYVTRRASNPLATPLTFDTIVSNASGNISGDLITINRSNQRLGSGWYSVRLENANGSVYSEPVTFMITDDVTSVSSIGNGYARISYSSSTGLMTPASISWCCNNKSKSDYHAVRSFEVLTDADISRGYIDAQPPNIKYPNKSRFQNDAPDNVWLVKVAFKTPNGLYFSDFMPVTVPRP